MPVLIALLLVVLPGLAAPALACTAGGGSTFCADGWISAPVNRERRESPDPGLSADGEVMSEGEIWVEGAVPVDEGSPSEDEGL